MTKINLKILLGVCLLSVLTATGWADSTCFSTYTNGSGDNAMNFCISRHGNILNFESPAFTTQLIDEEGYAVASGCGTPEAITRGGDAGRFEGGFGESTISQPNGANTFPLTITRDTTDGVFRLTQTFSRDTLEKDITATMTLKNLSASAVGGVYLTRYFGYLNAASFSREARSLDSVWGWHGFGLSLTGLAFAVSHSTVVQTRDTWLGGAGSLGDGCFETSVVDTTMATGTTTNGWAGRVVEHLGTMKAGGSKLVKVVYRRF